MSAILPGDHVTRAQSAVAFAYLAAVPLARIESQRSVTIPVMILDTPEWRNIRHVWGPPDYTIMAVSKRKNFSYCWSGVGLNIDIMDRGRRVPSEPDQNPPYYPSYIMSSGPCAAYTEHFRAEPGDNLAITITKSDTGPLPAGELIIQPAWDNQKDKIVGVMLDEDIWQLVRILVLSGAILIVPAAVLLLPRLRR